jgi:hypothetical protein
MTTTEGFVLDCSVALAWCFPDEHAPYPQSVLDSLATAAAAVPSLWFLEVANALLVGERRGRCTTADVATWLGLLAGLPIHTDPETTARAWSDIHEGASVKTGARRDRDFPNIHSASPALAGRHET